MSDAGSALPATRRATTELVSVERCSQPETTPINIATAELVSVERCSQPDAIDSTTPIRLEVFSVQ